MKFFIKDFFSKCDQICSFLRICSHLLKKSLIENFIFCAVIAAEETSEIVFSQPVLAYTETNTNAHCVKSVQMRSFFRSVLSCIWTEYGDLRCRSPYSVWIQENTDQEEHSNTGKCIRNWTTQTATRIE